MEVADHECGRDGDDGIVEFGPFRLARTSRRLTRDGVLVHLPPRAAAVLCRLAAEPGHVVTKDELLSAVWNGTPVADEALMQAVSLVRQALGDDPRAPRYIETVPREGYRFLSPTHRAEEDAVAAAGPGEVGTRIGLAIRGLLAAGVVLVLAAGAATVSDSTEAPRPVVLEVGMPDGLSLAAGTWYGAVRDPADAVAISPDGSTVVFAGREGDGPTRLYRRRLDRTAVEAVGGTEGGIAPFVSPDGLWVGFWKDKALWRVPWEGGPPLEIGPIEGHGATWLPDGDVVLRRDAAFWRLEAAGEGGRRLHRQRDLFGRGGWPAVTPDGAKLVYTRPATDGDGLHQGQLAFLSLETGEERLLALRGAAPSVTPTGHLVYLQDDGLYAAPFDLDRGEVLGPSVRVVDDVAMSRAWGTRTYAFAADGTLVYRVGGLDEASHLVRVTRDGDRTRLPLPELPFRHVRYSPDGFRLALGTEWSRGDIWIYDLRRRSLQRLTDSGDNHLPEWTSDDELLFTLHERDRHRAIVRWRADSGSAFHEILSNPALHAHGSVSPDGRWIAYYLLDGAVTGKDDIWIADRAGEVAPRPFLASRHREQTPVFSPDGGWIAYVSDETGRDEVYLRRFPDGSDARQVSVDGGRDPVWARTGDELYWSWEDTLMAARILGSKDPSIEPPEALFRARFSGLPGSYDVSPDGSEFVVATVDEPTPARLMVVVGWFDELRRRVPVPR